MRVRLRTAAQLALLATALVACAPAVEPLAADAPPAMRGRVLADGSVFLPKPGQFALGLRTAAAQAAQHRPQRQYSAVVQADPDRHGIVAAPEDGVLVLPTTRPIVPGMTVRKGDVLGWLEPALTASARAELQHDLATTRERAAIKQRDIEVLDARIRNQFSQASGTYALTELKVELDGLKAQDQALSKGLTRRALTAPISGVLAGRPQVSGDRIAASAPVFEIVDPAARWLDVAVPAAVAAQPVIDARHDGQTLKLVARTVGRVDGMDHLFFGLRPENVDTTPAIGARLRLDIATGLPRRGHAVPRDALVRRASGATVIWVQEQSERFVARPVVAEPLDADRLLLPAAILADGERVVVARAWMLDQF